MTASLLQDEAGGNPAALAVLATGVAALYLFLQANLTGCAHQPQCHNSFACLRA